VSEVDFHTINSCLECSPLFKEP